MRTYKPVKYVIFDMDGLLLDTEKLYVEAFNEMLQRYGVKEYTDEVKLKVLGTVPRDTYATLIKEYNLPVSLEDLTAEMTMALKKVMSRAGLMPGAERLVTHLKKHNIPIAVASSSSEVGFSMKTKSPDVQKFFTHFSHIVTGGSDPEVKKGKPAPDVFLLCASRFSGNPSPNECLVFEDAPKGVEAAVAAGMQVVMVPEPIIPEEGRKLATKVISSLLDFKPEEFGLPSF